METHQQCWELVIFSHHYIRTPIFILFERSGVVAYSTFFKNGCKVMSTKEVRTKIVTARSSKRNKRTTRKEHTGTGGYYGSIPIPFFY